MALDIMTFSIIAFIVTTLNNRCCYAECNLWLSVDMLGVMKQMYQAATKVTLINFFYMMRVPQHSAG
jgi:hypothetical protein